MNRRINDIECLRGLSISFIVFHHLKVILILDNSNSLNFLYRYFGFWFGIDIFFAISGFVVGRKLLPNLKEVSGVRDSFDFIVSFWAERFIRTWLPAWFWLLVVLLLTILFNNSGAFGGIASNIVASVAALVQVANFYFAQIEYSNAEYGASFIYWSLSQLEQFYMVLPLLVLFFRPYLMTFLFVFMIVKIILSLCFPDFMTLLSVLLRLDALILGVLIAIWSKEVSYRLFEPSVFGRPMARYLLLTLVFVCLFVLACQNLTVVYGPFNTSLIGLLAAILVYIASYDMGYLRTPGWTNGVFVYLGGRSYSLFLTHIPVFMLTKEIWFRLLPEGTEFNGAFNIRFTVTAFVLLIILTEFSYRFLERPLRNRGSRIRKLLHESLTARSS